LRQAGFGHNKFAARSQVEPFRSQPSLSSIPHPPTSILDSVFPLLIPATWWRSGHAIVRGAVWLW
jgi:hypothetical protein